ncbi:FecR family protein [bacterium A37T11]|nr:FecR family protein [bacterium A37T11]
MNREEARLLIHRYQQGQCTPQEKAAVEAWLNAMEQDESRADLTEANMLTAQQRILELFIQQHFPEKRIRLVSWYYTIAALLIVGAAVSFYFLIVSKSETPQGHPIVQTEIRPGYNQATLTLADGTKIDLDSAKAGIQVNDEAINYNDGTKIKAGTRHSTTITYNLLTTPKGGQYQIILSDGTKVWLNAQSTLKYPSRFSEDKREVFLEGEAYFEVNNNPSIGAMQANRKSNLVPHKSNAPFIVKSKNQAVLVLGTEFNLAAYADEKSTKTTLVSGAIQVATYDGKGSLNPSTQQQLLPGQRSEVKDGQIKISAANIKAETSWRNGRFDFQDMTFEEAMRQLARWYDLEITYKGKTPDIEFFGGLNRNHNFSTVKELLKNNQVPYRLEGHHLIIL